jgi:hypothetical protein
MDPASLLQRFYLDLPDPDSAAQLEVFLDDSQAMAQAFLSQPGVTHSPNGGSARVHPCYCQGLPAHPAAVNLESDLFTSLETPFSFDTCPLLWRLIGPGRVRDDLSPPPGGSPGCPGGTF